MLKDLKTLECSETEYFYLSVSSTLKVDDDLRSQQVSELANSFYLKFYILMQMHIH